MAETRIVGSLREGIRARSGVAPQGASVGARPTFSAVDQVGINGCTGRTKKGKLCAAHPVQGTTLCIGHTKAHGE